MALISKTALAVACALATSICGATASIDTTPAWNGTDDSGSGFGQPDTATYAQSITTDSTGGLLQSFTFFLSPLDLDFQAYVYEWDGVKAVGSPLFTSDLLNIGDTHTGYAPVEVATGGVVLVPDRRYVLLFSTSGLQVGDTDITNTWAALSSDAYAGGEFVFHNSGNDLAALVADAGWDCGDGCGWLGEGADLAFMARITPVPEPGAGLLLMAGLAVVGRIASRRRPCAVETPAAQASPFASSNTDARGW